MTKVCFVLCVRDRLKIKEKVVCAPVWIEALFKNWKKVLKLMWYEKPHWADFENI